MDGNVFGLVLLLLILGGNGVDSFVRNRQRHTDREADKQRWATLAKELQELKSKLDLDYLLREPHMAEHKKINEQMRELAQRMTDNEKQIAKISQRRGWE
ncbi:hypothetical protein [Desulfovibrio sp. SGI.169]|uniref:hypothetical protein n=1 Tax=Desulfovibrio sp. SGI.169 TaxID=3420561 RepID=UPI003D02DB47